VGSLYLPRVNAEFNVWLLIVGLILGAGLVWLVVMDSRRREADVDADERPREAAWLAAVMAEDGFEIGPEAAEHLLVLHRAYLGAPPPDEIEDLHAGDLAQSPPPSTGGAASDGPDASTSETPNRASLDTPESAGTGPIQ
jgi:hypothetical protein